MIRATKAVIAVVAALAATGAAAQATTGAAAQATTGAATQATTGAAAQSAPGDPVAGRQKTQMCAGCHGIEGWRTAYPEVYPVPRIAGQHPAYLVKALQAYKSGERSHPSMRAIAASLSDKDMADLAAYYAETSLRTAVK
jgi:cytochrome c553